MSDDTSDIRARIQALVPPEQAPFIDFELRMLTTTLEMASLQHIHQHWRPIADERDKLRQLLAIANAKPPRDRSAKSADTEPDLQVRFDALSQDQKTLQRNYASLQDRHDDLRAEYLDLQEKHRKLQADCDDLLADQNPRRTA